MNRKVVVIGGDAAGMSAASQIKRQKRDWHVKVFEKGKYVSYAACGMPYYIQGAVSHFNSLIEIKPETFINDRGIDLKLNSEVLRIYPENNSIEVNIDGELTQENYDYLVIATGASPNFGDFPINSNKVFTINNLYDTEKLEKFIEQSKPKSVGVIGGGFIAIEMVEAFKSKGLDTHLIHRRDSLSKIFEKEVSDLILSEMKKREVVLHLNKKIKAIKESNNKVEVITEKENLAFDFVLLAIGVVPNTDFIKNSDIKTGVRNAISVNEYLQTNFPNIYSAGDCTETFSIVTNEKVYTPLALKANREGMLAGLNISGKKEKFPGVCETAITKFFHLGIARTGITYDRAVKNGIDAVKFDLISRTKARYYPGSEKIKSFVVADKDRGRVLGVQLAGPLDSVKRIDVWATIIYNKMNLHDVFNLDLAYSPPFAPVWDPVLLAARIGRRHVSKNI
jgi:NADPH-dependent 2,4-dienoyl-CoA reductase/sulfur reductase-like enzyme